MNQNYVKLIILKQLPKEASDSPNDETQSLKPICMASKGSKGHNYVQIRSKSYMAYINLLNSRIQKS